MFVQESIRILGHHSLHHLLDRIRFLIRYLVTLVGMDIGTISSHTLFLEFTGLMLIKTILSVATMREKGTLNNNKKILKFIQQIYFFLLFSTLMREFIFFSFNFILWFYLLITLSVVLYFFCIFVEWYDNSYSLRRMEILTSFKVFAIGIKFAFILSIL